VRIDPRYYQPTAVETLLGDAAKARAKLGWSPENTLEQMIREMVAADLALEQQISLLRQHGYAAPISKEN
jgi:GDPmannose 4,6-dehydratase